MLKRTKYRKHPRLKRTKKPKLETNELRNQLIKHVLIYNKHWKEDVHRMPDWFLLMHVHPSRRQELYRLFSHIKLPNYDYNRY